MDLPLGLGETGPAAGPWPRTTLLEAATVWKQLPCSSALFGQG
jgi:hypothetical protein